MIRSAQVRTSQSLFQSAVSYLRSEAGRTAAFTSFAFLLPLYPDASSGFLFLWLPVYLLLVDKSRLIRQKGLLLPVLFFLVYLVSYLTSDQGNMSLIGRKLSLAMIPVIFFLHGRISHKTFTGVLHAFVAGCVAALFVCELYALYNYGYAWWRRGNMFITVKFSAIHQTVYFGMYIVMALLILFYYPFKNKWSTRGAALFLAIGLFQISNKASVLILFALIVLHIFWRTKGIYRKVFTLASLVLFGLLMTLTVPRWKDTIKNLRQNGLTIVSDSHLSDQLRLVTWETSLSLIKENFLFGVGLGDSQHELNQRYAERGYVVAAHRSLNSHNTYLSVWLENGLPGLLCVLGFFVFLYRHAKMYPVKLHFYVSFILLLAINFAFESMFSRYSGLAFIGFFYGLLLMYTGEGNVVESKTTEA